MDEVNKISREMSRKHYQKPSHPWTTADKVALLFLGLMLLVMILALGYTLMAMPLQP